MKPILLFIIYVGIILCIGGKAETSINTEEKISRLENLFMDVNSRLEIVESKNHALENEKNEMKSQLNLLELEKTELRSKLDDINDEVDHLKELTKILSVRTCDEMHMYGVNKSNYYFIDPDGALNGEEPIRVYCDFTEDFGLTQISHNTCHTSDGPGGKSLFMLAKIFCCFPLVGRSSSVLLQIGLNCDASCKPPAVA